MPGSHDCIGNLKKNYAEKKRPGEKHQRRKTENENTMIYDTVRK